MVDVEKPRDTVLDVTVRDDVDDRGRDVVVVDGVYDAGSADRCAPPGLALFEIFFCDQHCEIARVVDEKV